MDPIAQPTVSTLLATATAFMKVFETLDPSTIVPVQSSNYKHVFAPESLNVPGPLDRDDFAHHLTRINGILRSFPVRFKEAWPNPSLSQVVIWSDSETQFHDHVKDNDDEEEWKFKGEYMWVLTMDESGQKVEHVLEFLDSKKTEVLRVLMARAFKKKEEVDGYSGTVVAGGWEL